MISWMMWLKATMLLWLKTSIRCLSSSRNRMRQVATAIAFLCIAVLFCLLCRSASTSHPHFSKIAKLSSTSIREFKDPLPSECGPVSGFTLGKWTGSYDTCAAKLVRTRGVAWIHVLLPHRWTWTMWPAAATLAEALENSGMEVHIRRADKVCDILAAVMAWSNIDEKDGKDHKDKGPRPMVIGIAPHHQFKQGPAVKTLADCRSDFPDQAWVAMANLGAYRVLYQTEPWPEVWRHALEKAKRLRVNEIWEYSRFAMHLYPNATKTSKNTISVRLSEAHTLNVRYFPAGCVKALQASFRPEDIETNNVTRIGFLGRWSVRSKKKRREYLNSFPNDMTKELKVDSIKALAEVALKYPIQMNTHSSKNGVGDGRFALEPLRFSTLLSNRACILSEKANAEEEDEFKGVIYGFYKNAIEMRDAFDRLRADPPVLRECLESTHRFFCTNYDPQVLLQKSGFDMSSLH